MADTFSREKRSWIMSRVKSKHTLPEILVRRYLHSKGFRFRLHVKELPGKPDIVLPKYKSIILVHGCFWHGHSGCAKARLPKTRTEWWEKKMNYNIVKDAKTKRLLKKSGWSVITVWQCQLTTKKGDSTLKKIAAFLKKRANDIN
jgi:DNA mismatch endonuclease, patch repair protein